MKPGKPRIAIYLRDLLGGGVEKRMLILAEELLKRDYEIDLLLENETGELLDHVPDGVSVIPLTGSMNKETDQPEKNGSKGYAALKKPFSEVWYFLLRKFNREEWYRTVKLMRRDFKRYRYGFKAARLYYFYLTKLKYSKATYETTLNLADYLRKVQPPIAITGLENQNFRLIIAKYLAGAKTKCVISVRNHLTTFFPLYYSSSWHRNYRAAVRHLYPKADKIVAVSNGIKKDLEQQFEIPLGRIEVIYNPVVNNNVTSSSAEPTSDDDWLDSDVPVLLGIGRLHPQKGFDVLLKALAQVLKKVPVRLILLGNGPEREKLENLAGELGVKGHARFPGFSKNPFPYMAKSSLFVLSSLNEGLPGVLIEAMACGCPVVATDCPSGPAEILENGKYGKLVPVGDVEKLADAIVAALKQEHDKSLLKKRANDFSVEKSVNRYIQLFNAT